LKNSKTEITGWATYFTLSLYSALNIASIRYGSPDDLSISSMQFGKNGIIENSIESAKETGRIQQVPFYILNSLGLKENPYYLTQIIKFISALLIFSLFSILIKQLYGKQVSLVSSLIFISTFTTTGEYNSINSFPLWFSLGIIAYLGSCIAFIKYLSNSSNKVLFITLCLFTISLLSSEIYFLLVLIFPAIQIKLISSGSMLKKFIMYKNFYISIVSITSIYFLAYQFFKISSKGSYEGTQLTFKDPLKSLLSTVFLSFGQINVYGLKRTIFDGTFTFNLLILFVFCILFVFLYKYLKSTNSIILFNQKAEILTILFFALSANVLLGFTVKYSKIGLIYPLYLHSLISYLFLSLFFALILIRLSHIRIFAIILTLFLSLFGFISYSDQYVEYNKLRNNQLVFNVVDCLASQKGFTEKVAEQVLSPDIQIASKAYTYNYFGEKLGKQLNKNFLFQKDLSAIDQELPYTEISLFIKNGEAEGIFHTIGSNLEQKGIFSVSNHNCQVR
jgi:hypothetical protein